MSLLEIKNLKVRADNRELLHGVNLCVKQGARHLIRGHNGSGKTTLVQTVSGNPDYEIEGGKIIFDGYDVTGENSTKRALLGIFLGGQNVPEIVGLTWLSFLKHSATAHCHFETGKELAMGEFLTRLEVAREKLNIPKEWLNRSVNVGFSGGERKRMMFLRLLIAAPKLAILDEPDSGADSDTLELFGKIIQEMNERGTTFVLVSHQEKFTNLFNPTNVTTLENGNIKN